MENGKMYFYTASIYKWIPVLKSSKPKEIILNSLTFLTEMKAIKLYAFVIMPNHIHLILMPLENPKIRHFQLSFMRFTGQYLKYYLQKYEPMLLERFLVNKIDRKYRIWQRDSLAVELYSREVMEEKLEYIHNNPVQGKWLLSDSPLTYKYSSCRFYEEDNFTEFPFLTHYMDALEQ